MRQAVADIPRFKAVGDRPVEAGDRVVITTVTHDAEGEPLGNLTRERLPVYLKDQFVPEGLRDGIVGMEVGETRRVGYRAPTPENDENGEAIKIDVVAQVTLNEIQAYSESGLDDAWVAATIPGASTVEEFRKVVRDQMEAKADHYTQEAVYAACAAELVNCIEGEIPDEMIMRGYEDARADFNRMLETQKTTKEEYLKCSGVTEEQLNVRLLLQGRKTIAEGMALEAMADHVNPKITDEDIDGVFGQASPMQIKKLREEYERMGKADELRRVARCGKAMDYVVEHAHIEYRAVGESVDPFAVEEGEA